MTKGRGEGRFCLHLSRCVGLWVDQPVKYDTLPHTSVGVTR